MPRGIKESAVARVMRMIDTRSPSECWPWTGSLRVGAYPAIHVGETEARRLGLRPGKVLVSRYLVSLRQGPIAPGMVVMHGCDQPLCCSPSHLRVGTQKQNICDARDRGRLPTTEARRASALRSARRGESHPRSRWSNAMVAEMRERHRGGESVRDLAVLLRAPEPTVYAALVGRTYASAPSAPRRPQ